MDKVGVVTACYNTEKYIGECVRSVRNSVTLDEFEILHTVVDDCSTDKSAAIVKELTEKNLQIIINGINRGPSVSRNTGLKSLTDTEFVFFLDADDMLFQNSLRYLRETADQTKSDWIYGDFIKSDDQGKYMAGNDYYGWKFHTADELLYAIFTGKHYFQQNSFFRTANVVRAGGFDESLFMAEDLDLAIRLVLSGTMPVFLPGPLYIHRLHSSNLSIGHTGNPELHRESLKGLYRKYEKELKNILAADRLNKIEETIIRYNP